MSSGWRVIPRSSRVLRAGSAPLKCTQGLWYGSREESKVGLVVIPATRVVTVGAVMGRYRRLETGSKTIVSDLNCPFPNMQPEWTLRKGFTSSLNSCEVERT